MKYLIPALTAIGAVIAFILTQKIDAAFSVILAVVWVTSGVMMLTGDRGDNSWVRQGAMFMVWGVLTVSGLMWLAYLALGQESIIGVWFGGVVVVTVPIGLLVYGINYLFVWQWSTKDDRRREIANAEIAERIRNQVK